jgi:hypothetical protein
MSRRSRCHRVEDIGFASVRENLFLDPQRLNWLRKARRSDIMSPCLR